MVKFLDLYSQYKSIQNEIDHAIKSVITDTAFIGGKYVKQFEAAFAAFLGCGYCIGVGNGTDAIEIAIESLELPRGSEIIVPANTFIASSEAVTRSGYKVVFCDCNADNYTIDTDDVKRRITAKTSAVIAVHLYGHPCDMGALLAIASENKIKVIEDCAQSHGAEYKGKMAGGLGDIAAFSFYPGKNLGAYGDGGAIVTNNNELAEKCRMIANHGRMEKYNHMFEGRNSRLDGLQAAILNIKLKYLNSWLEARRNVAALYRESLSGISEIILPVEEEWAKHVYHLFVIRTNARDSLADYLKENGINTGIHYPISLPKLKAYSYLGQDIEDIKANKFDSQLLSLPMGEHLSSQDINTVCSAIKNYFK